MAAPTTVQAVASMVGMGSYRAVSVWRSPRSHNLSNSHSTQIVRLSGPLRGGVRKPPDRRGPIKGHYGGARGCAPPEPRGPERPGRPRTTATMRALTDYIRGGRQSRRPGISDTLSGRAPPSGCAGGDGRSAVPFPARGGRRGRAGCRPSRPRPRRRPAARRERHAVVRRGRGRTVRLPPTAVQDVRAGPGVRKGYWPRARPHRAPTPALPRPARRPSVAAVRVRGARPGAFSPARCSWRVTRSSFAAQARYCSHVAACRAPPNRRTSSGGLESLRRMGTCQAGPLPTCYGPETGGRPTRRCRGADPASR